MKRTEDQLIARARQLRARQEVDHRDELRTIRELADLGMTQRLIAEALCVTQQAVSYALKCPTPQPAQGFSGASPTEICQRYAAGLLSREPTLSRDDAIDELSRWDYTPLVYSDGYDWNGQSGSFIAEVVPACDNGLIDEDMYQAILDRIMLSELEIREFSEYQPELAVVRGDRGNDPDHPENVENETWETYGQSTGFRVFLRREPGKLVGLVETDNQTGKFTVTLKWPDGPTVFQDIQVSPGKPDRFDVDDPFPGLPSAISVHEFKQK